MHHIVFGVVHEVDAVNEFYIIKKGLETLTKATYTVLCLEQFLVM